METLYGFKLSALVDSGCSHSIMCEKAFERCVALCGTNLVIPTLSSGTIRMLDGSTVDFGKTAVVELVMENKLLSLDVIVVPRIACRFQLILGMNARHNDHI